MINSEYAELFRNDAVDKQFSITFDGGVIGNDQISMESFELTEALCSDQVLTFGSCCASVLKMTILNNVIPLKGKKLDVTCSIQGMGEPFRFGTFKVDSDKPTADRKYRDIEAYDAIHDIFHADVTDWYNALPFPLTLRQFRDSFFKHFEIEQEPATLINDTMTVEQTIQPSELTGGTVITALCELNGCFGHINRQGCFTCKLLPEIVNGLYPANDLYPQDTHFPRDSSTELIGGSLYKTCQYEDYTCKRIDKLQIRQEENDIGAIAGTGDNCYTIQDNFLVYGKGAEELQAIADNVFSVIHKVRYQPFEAQAKGSPCREVGDAVRFHTTNAVIESYILRRTLKGIQALTDSYTAEGQETYAEKVPGVKDQIIQLRGKTNTLTRTVEETRLAITDLESGLSTKITQTAELIQTEVERLEGADRSLSSRITQTAESIEAEVKRAMSAESSAVSRISMTEQSIAAEVKRSIDAETSLSSRIEQTAYGITSEVTRAQKAESSLSSKITQTAEAIELKVSKGEVSSQLSMESGKITIKSDRFVLSSTNCSITADGSIKAKNADLSGKIAADSGTIGGFTIAKNAIYKGKDRLLSGDSGIYIGTDGISCGSSGLLPAFKLTSAGDIEIRSGAKIDFNFGDTRITSIKISAGSNYMDKNTLRAASPTGTYTEITYAGLKHYLSATTGYELTNDNLKFYGKTAGITIGGATVVTVNDTLAKFANTVTVIGTPSGKIGFFGGGTPSAKKTVAAVSTAAGTTTIVTKLNELINALKAYNLIG